VLHDKYRLHIPQRRIVRIPTISREREGGRERGREEGGKGSSRGARHLTANKMEKVGLCIHYCSKRKEKVPNHSSTYAAPEPVDFSARVYTCASVAVQLRMAFFFER